jgi:membrane peptidoglycan carboxypeptidase
MPTAPHIIQLRQKRRQVFHKNPTGRIGLAIAFLFTLLVAFGLIIVPTAYANTLQDLPSLATIPLLLEPPNGLLLHPTLILDRSGEHILQRVQNPAVEERRYLPISTETDPNATEFIAPEMVDATVSIADPTFWSNPGFSIEGLFDDQALTLAQQLAAELLIPSEESNLRRAIRERILGWQIITQFGRPKVLEWYLNSTYYGNLAYGIDAASQVYFGKSASELNLAEAALLTAVGQAPALNPIDAPEEALNRQKIVLDAMVGQGYITSAEAIEAAEMQLKFREPAEKESNPAQAYLNLVWEQLAPFYDLERIERGGYQIITTLDYDLQLQVNCTRETLLTRVKNPTVDLSSPDCPAARLLPTLAIDSQNLPTDLRATVVVLEPGTGQILALVGDPAQGLDPAHLPGRPPGSMLTPFLYLTAFTRGFSPASLLWDVPIEIPEVVLPEADKYQGPVRLREALANDYLIPAIQTMSQIGADNVWRTTQELGLTSFARYAGESNSSSCRGCGLLFDGGEVTLLELTHAYSTFANQGLMVGQPLGTSDATSLPPLVPISILNISDIHGQEWLHEPDTERRPVITQQLAYLITHVLSDESARWPSMGHPNSLEIGRPAAAKAGETSTHQDTWTIGYTPQTIVGVWVGNGNSGNSEGEVPSKISAALWNVITQYATQDLPPTAWEIPPGISFVDVCDPSGQLPTRYCPMVVNEVFLNGNEPTQFDNLYQAYQINRETEHLATVFTPPELVEERVYMQIPPIASQWARENNIPLPPESYDVIAMPPVNAEAKIAEPEMFANVSGEIEIRGTASGDDFISYRLQAGQGLNPQAWIQISTDSTTPVEDGLLANWDTSELNGLFAIQMIVLRENRQVDSTTIQVTIDNLSPEVSIPYPENGQVFKHEFGQYITFQAEASDNIGLKSVVFYVGDRELLRQSQPPYAVPWRSSPGEYTLRVEAIDLAGNISEASINFSVEE